MPPLAAMPLVRQVMKLQNVVTRGLHGVHPSIDGPLEGGGICVIGRTDHLLHTLPHMLVQVVQDHDSVRFITTLASALQSLPVPLCLEGGLHVTVDFSNHSLQSNY
ncbi:unnamed protein product [Lepeophtheirus salmonis]|uniref:(salmon louse) hypothetical protein n=1 Tax=Lepeophtheirus salmonis TaxID=72036 RepID=A0A7R8CFX0_LEPSM|nr:unnamed protein product [Lepeophtheirus salmonis]CAF2810445.1 unnamed protein product [Lepeophtheirus salmonis]